MEPLSMTLSNSLRILTLIIFEAMSDDDEQQGVLGTRKFNSPREPKSTR
jgi:hypothetical protein